MGDSLEDIVECSACVQLGKKPVCAEFLSSDASTTPKCKACNHLKVCHKAVGYVNTITGHVTLFEEQTTSEPAAAPVHSSSTKSYSYASVSSFNGLPGSSASVNNANSHQKKKTPSN